MALHCNMSALAQIMAWCNQTPSISAGCHQATSHFYYFQESILTKSMMSLGLNGFILINVPVGFDELTMEVTEHGLGKCRHFSICLCTVLMILSIKLNQSIHSLSLFVNSCTLLSQNVLINLSTLRPETKWTTFRRGHFQMYFLQWKCLNFD